MCFLPKKENEQIGAGVCVEFSTVDGHYAATWSKETSQISLTMPGGAILYAVGTTVTYDTSGGIKKHDPKQTVEDHKEDKFGPIVNTNGNYIFDVVWKISMELIQLISLQEAWVQYFHSTKLIVFLIISIWWSFTQSKLYVKSFQKARSMEFHGGVCYEELTQVEGIKA